jgi:hypothetical protein
MKRAYSLIRISTENPVHLNAGAGSAREVSRADMRDWISAPLIFVLPRGLKGMELPRLEKMLLAHLLIILDGIILMP